MFRAALLGFAAASSLNGALATAALEITNTFPNSVEAGSDFSITWISDASQVPSYWTISLELYSYPNGSESDTQNYGQPVMQVAASVPVGYGNYTWDVPTSVSAGSNYAFQITADQDPQVINYSGRFTIDNANPTSNSTNSTDSSDAPSMAPGFAVVVSAAAYVAYSLL